MIADAEALLQQADRAGALRGVAFARALIGEAALLMGDLERADRELTEAVELHHDTDAPAGESHCLQRLAEVRLAQGDPVEARRLLQRALPLARWSVVAHHLLHRIHGTMIAAAPTQATARAIVDQAQATIGDTDVCSFCVVMFAVPAAIACAQVGDLDAARSFIGVATAPRSSGRAPPGRRRSRRRAPISPWPRDSQPSPSGCCAAAAAGFRAAGQPSDVARCTRELDELRALTR